LGDDQGFAAFRECFDDLGGMTFQVADRLYLRRKFHGMTPAQGVTDFSLNLVFARQQLMKGGDFSLENTVQGASSHKK